MFRTDFQDDELGHFSCYRPPLKSDRWQFVMRHLLASMRLLTSTQITGYLYRRRAWFCGLFGCHDKRSFRQRRVASALP